MIEGISIIVVILVAGHNNLQLIKAQRKLLLSQIKKGELDKLNEMLNKPLDAYMRVGLDLDYTIFGIAGQYLSDFLSFNNSLFSMLNDKDVKNAKEKITESLNEIIGLFEYYKDSDELIKNDFARVDKLINNYLWNKNQLMIILHNSILKELK